MSQCARLPPVEAEGIIVRKMDVAPNGNPVIATSTVNGVGMVEIK